VYARQRCGGLTDRALFQGSINSARGAYNLFGLCAIFPSEVRLCLHDGTAGHTFAELQVIIPNHCRMCASTFCCLTAGTLYLHVTKILAVFPLIQTAVVYRSDLIVLHRVLHDLLFLFYFCFIYRSVLCDTSLSRFYCISACLLVLFFL